MRNPIEWAQARVNLVRERVGGFVNARRERRRWLDHGIRAVQRYQVVRGDQLAGAVTYYAFLSFFPLVALAFALVGYAVVISPNAADVVNNALNDVLPGLAQELPISQIAAARTGAGIIGLLGLLYAGMGWIDALRDALRRIWLTGTPAPNIVLAKLGSVLSLAAFGTALVASVAMSSVATSATHAVMGWLGLDGSPATKILVRLLAVAASMAADTLILLILFGRLSGAREPFRAFLRGAVFGAFGLAVLKIAGTWLIGKTTGNAIYGTFAILVGLLVWINFTSRFILFAAAWTATSTKGLPPEPSPPPLSSLSPLPPPG